MKIKNTMRSKLIITVLLGCFLPSLIGGLYLRSFFNQWSYYEALQHSTLVLNRVDDIIDELMISDMKEEVSMLASLDIIKNATDITNYANYDVDTFVRQPKESEKVIQEYFHNMKESHEDINFIFLATINGGYMEYPELQLQEAYDPRSRAWYQNTLKHDGIYISEPYITKITKDIVVSITQKVVKNSEITGIVGISLNLNDLAARIGAIKMGESGFIMVLSSDGKFIVNPNHSDWIMKTPQECGISELSIHNNQTIGNEIVLDGVTYNMNERETNTGWKIISAIQKDEIMNNSNKTAKILFIIFISTSALIILLMYFLMKRITNPILAIATALKRMTVLDFKRESSLTRYAKRSDEIGTVADALIDMQEEINHYIKQVDNNYMEISAKNDMLTASEEELTAQLEEINQQKDYINYLAYHDSLTGLPNRRSFKDNLEKKLNSGKKGAIILLDLDDFKNINDIMGHIYGDRVLQMIAKRIETIINQKLFASRIGGDEFLFLVEFIEQKSEVNENINNIMNIFSTKFQIDEVELDLSISMGIAFYPEDSNDVDRLIMQADLAMYTVKREGKNNYQYYNVSMKEKQIRESYIEKLIKHAIRHKGFYIEYQPVINLKTGTSARYEALLRMEGDDRYTMPGSFIPVAEKCGLIISIGRIVTEEVIKQMNEWRTDGIDLKPVSINFSANQLLDVQYVEFISSLLDKYMIEPSMIEIEITENIFIENTQVALKFFRNLKDLGISIAIDDFGTGYSSLNYLTSLPIDSVKLDRSLNLKFLESSNDNLMNCMISLVHSLGFTVVAEGIEIYEHAVKLKTADCDYIQGYYFSKPLNPEQISEVNAKIYTITEEKLIE